MSPNQPMASPNGGWDGNPNTSPIGENNTMGMVRSALMTKRRSIEATMSAPWPAAGCPGRQHDAGQSAQSQP